MIFHLSTISTKNYAFKKFDFKGKSVWVWDMNLGCKELGI
jgi:hypothetical protein